jgi:hypothetical protein
MTVFTASRGNRIGLAAFGIIETVGFLSFAVLPCFAEDVVVHPVFHNGDADCIMVYLVLIGFG